jgi:two-component system chemotaxis response regulator CheB
MFRSAAVAYGTRVIGVLMSGELDDGTAGLQAIKQCGGIAVVQEPEDAKFPAMPNIALSNVAVDYRVKSDELPTLIQTLTSQSAPAPVAIAEELRKEVALAEAPENSLAISESFGSPSTFSCPECGGPLWSHGDHGERLRCMVGHSFGLTSFLQGLEDGIDQTVWAAIRMFEQRFNITRMMADQERRQGRAQRAELYESRAQESRAHAQRLRELHRVRGLTHAG